MCDKCNTMNMALDYDARVLSMEHAQQCIERLPRNIQTYYREEELIELAKNFYNFLIGGPMKNKDNECECDDCGCGDG